MADVDMPLTNEEEKIQSQLAPTPNAAHNPDSKMTSDGGEFQDTKMFKTSKMAKTKNVCDIM